MAKHDSSLNDLFKALSDPTRRGMIERLMSGPATVGDLAEPLDMALPTVLGHVRMLERSGLISTRKEGRTRVCHVEAKPLDAASDWLSRQRALWDARLDRLEAFLDQQDDTDDD